MLKGTLVEIVVALAAGYLWGGLPTADLIARMRGVDLRAGGSMNPGANNALRLGGRSLAASVLAVEVAKGFFAAWIGGRLAGDPAMAAASIGAVAGNIFNPYFRGRGGKGLAMMAGVTLAAWPAFLPIGIGIVALSLVLIRQSGPATLILAVTCAAASLVWAQQGWPTGWGIHEGAPLSWLGIGIGALLVPKAVRDSLNPMKVGDERRREVPPPAE